MALIGVAASVLLAFLIYKSTRSHLENNFSTSQYFPLFKQPLQMLVSQPLYILHQLADWAMVYYARTHLKCSHKLQPFHYWMVGVNLVFVLLYIAWYYLFPEKISYHLPLELPLVVLGLSYWFLIAKSSGRGLIFGYSILSLQGIAEVAEVCLPYYFSFAVLLNFWYKPFNNRYMLFFLRLVVELIFITHSCLLQTHVYENKYWTLFLELTVLPYYFMIVIFPTSHIPAIEFLLFSLAYVAVFVISQMHELNFLTRMMKIVIAVLPISLAILWDLIMIRSIHVPLSEKIIAVLCSAIIIYYGVFIIIMVFLIMCQDLIGTVIKKKNDDSYFHKKK